jgi:hypothetical protein
MDTSRWSATLKCDEEHCGEYVNAHGDNYFIDDHFDDQEGCPQWALAEVHRIHGMYPAVPIFRVSKNVPYSVASELRLAFAMYWTDRSACVARLRTAVERLLDEQGVPKHGAHGSGKVSRLDLHGRINAFAAGSAHAQQMQGLRNIGNLGTHGNGDVTNEDLFDAMDVLEFVLAGIYDTQTIDAKANRLKIKKQGDC